MHLSGRYRRLRRAERLPLASFAARRGHRARQATFLLLAFSFLGQAAASSDPKFETISIEDGLSQNIVTSVLSDRRGFLWIGTDGGLNRYDGHTFNIFTYCRSKRNCLSHDRINCMAEDEDGSFWIGTTGGGLNHFDPVSEEFSSYRAIADDPGSLSNDSLRAMLPEGKHILWIGTDNGLNHFDGKTGKFTRYLYAREVSELSARNAIYSLHRDGNGILWVGSGDGLFRFDPAAKAFARFAIDSTDRNSQLHNQVNAIGEDHHGTLWLGTEGGLVRFDKHGGTFQFRRETDTTLPHLYRSRIFCIFPDKQGRVWAGTEAGLYLFPRRELLEIYFQAKAIPKRLLKNRFVITLYQDRENIIWIGTLGGMHKFDLRSQQFSMFGSEIIGKERGSGIFPVLAMCRDARDGLWIGTYKNGLIWLSGGLEETIKIVPFPGNPQDGKDMIIPALLIGSDQVLWVGTNKGLYGYDLVQGAFRDHYVHGPAEGSLSHNLVTALCEDRAGRLWVGTHDGLNLLDRSRRVFTVYGNELERIESAGGNYISNIYPDRRGVLWIGTYGGGLNVFDPEQGRYVRNYRHRQGDNSSLNSDKVYCLLEDRRGRLWVGTNSGGLGRLDRASGRFTNFTRENGLVNNDIMGMLEDQRGNLWLSTNRGLCRFDPQRNVARNFMVRDGLQGDEFQPMSYYKSMNGEMFFGGINGLTCFFPENIADNPFLPPVIITGIEVFNRGQKLTGDFGRMRELRLGPKDRTVSFAFAALSFSDPKRNRYAYKIDGLHDDWIQIGNRHEITVSNLRPGSYVFRVKGSNNHGLWNEQGASLAILMRPSWWQTWWFRVPAFFLVLSLFIAFNRTRTRRMAARIRSEAAMEKFLEKYDISQREKEIIHLLLKGKSNKEIENALFIAMGTVKNHIYSIYQKIGVRNRAQLITLFKNIQIK
jgi:ligand-binding sensor domain-containing protein/DNA-binding CsgD family transcriptional regulator